MAEDSGLKAVIFDLDGILCDTSKYHGKAWGDLVRSLGCEPPADLEEQVRGISRMASLKIALGKNAAHYNEKELEELASRKNDWYLKAIQGITPADAYPGVHELFKDLRQAGVKIVLGSASKNAKTVLEGLQLADAFDAIADGFTYKHGKPHPDVFVTGARMVGLQPHECIVVEDATAGINAALDGGFVTVGMGRHESLRHAHLFVKSLCELDAKTLIALHARYRADRWTVSRDGYRPDREGPLNTIFSIGNGHIGIRGNQGSILPGKASGIFVAGLFDRVERLAPDPDKWDPYMKYWGVPELARGVQVEVCLVNCPNFLDMEWTVEDETVDLTQGTLKSLARRLDLQSGTFATEAHWVSPKGREIRLTQHRFADVAGTDRVFVQYTVEALNFSGNLRVKAGIDGTTVNTLGNGPQQLYSIGDIAAAGPNAVAMHVRGKTDGAEAAFATGIHVLDRHGVKYEITLGSDRADIVATIHLAKDKILYIERACTFATARRQAKPMDIVKRTITDALTVPFGDARIASTAQWRQYWENSDVVVEGNDADQLAIRFSIFNLLIAAAADDPGVSIAAKGLTGEMYRGMVFWDTDIYMTPFYTFTQPAMARNLAMFRFLTLAGAREKAKRYGNCGASYPWETGVSGREECEKWLKLITHQLHITADVAYFLQQYVDVTGDMDFYENAAAEVLIETARFWVSKAVGRDGALSIPQAGGPDEFHVVCDDSAFINNCAALNLKLADRSVQHLRRKAPAKLTDILKRTGATEQELSQFAETANRIRTMQDKNGLFEQCAGFFQLRDTGKEPGPAPQETQVVKQADVMLMLFLLHDQWSKDVWRVNWDYYEPRTVHASSLSQGVHGIMALELGMPETADRYIRTSLGMDLNDAMWNTEQGAHMAANGMNWLAVVQAYGGTRPQGDRILVEPKLPKDWSRLRFRLKWRGSDFVVDIGRDKVAVQNLPSAKADLPLRIGGKNKVAHPGESITA